MSTSNDPQVSDRNDPKPAADPKAKDNDYSPDFKPEREPKPETDADIDTQGG
ncbi:hypothetical protein [Pseudomonas rhodesiae]|uniref:hypothetical protein n=1 Tax=Pseudomonas rhodesiae TaxID=76760 RepID=UPI000A560F7C|nr:hypothetical protein [Pseudomonas rhodesiae]